jgi:hypothetical protein
VLIRQDEKIDRQGKKIIAMTYSLEKKNFRGLL